MKKSIVIIIAALALVGAAPTAAAPTMAQRGCVTVKATGHQMCGPEAKGYCEATVAFLPEIVVLAKALQQVGLVTSAQVAALQIAWAGSHAACAQIGVNVGGTHAADSLS
jgi:hypothetical protein